MEQFFKTTIAGKPVICDANLQGFDLHKTASTNVDYFAINKGAKQLFIQFNSGKGYIYLEVDENTLQDAIDAPSIGKYYYAQIKGKFTEQFVADRAIRPDVQVEEDYEEDEDIADLPDWEDEY
jgi:hypothetical protein